MKKILLAMMAAVLLVGTTGCVREDNPTPVDVNALEKELVGLWWDEFEYADVTETGVPFSRVLLEYGINIIDHAVEPMQQSIIVVRQLVQALQKMQQAFYTSLEEK